MSGWGRAARGSRDPTRLSLPRPQPRGGYELAEYTGECVSIDDLPEPAWLAPPEGGSFFNRLWHAYTGVPEDVGPLPDGTWATLIHPADWTVTLDAWTRSLADAAPYSVQYRLRSRDGEYRWFQARGRPMLHPTSGEILGWAGTVVDIDDAKTAVSGAEGMGEPVEWPCC